jgi:hypothetical protein
MEILNAKANLMDLLSKLPYEGGTASLIEENNFIVIIVRKSLLPKRHRQATL